MNTPSTIASSVSAAPAGLMRESASIHVDAHALRSEAKRSVERALVKAQAAIGAIEAGEPGDATPFARISKDLRAALAQLGAIGNEIDALARMQ